MRSLIQNRRSLHSLFLVAMLMAFQGLKAGKEPELRSYKLCSDLSNGDTLLVYDQLFLNGDGTSTAVSTGDYHLHNTTNSITLEVDQNTVIDCNIPQFSLQIVVEITRLDANGSAIGSPETVTLDIAYDKTLGKQYKEKHTLLFTGGFWYNAEIISITPSNPSVLPFVKLSIGTLIERYKDINTVTLPAFNAATFSSTNNEITFHWDAFEGAEEYDLEWTWYDDYSNTDIISNDIDPTLIDYTFKNNATRVTVKGTSYSISPAFERGFLLVRVRAIGYTGVLFTHRVEGAWSSDSYGPKIQNSTGTSFTDGYDRIYIDNPWSLTDYKAHELTLNWQYSCVFAEEGKKKEVISYFDGSLHNRQSVTKINTDQQAIVGETVYDYQGRAAVNILPVPAFENKLKFYPGFNLSNTSGLPYSRSDFDIDDGSCSNAIAELSTASGASKYYSEANPMASQMHHEYLPMANGFPFTVTEYMPDATGRVRRQGGVGDQHQLGSNHETKYYYARPDQEELDMLFGNSVGYQNHYQKNMVVDPNGQVSISYLDLSGKVIATALAGGTPENVESLPGTPSATDIVVDVKSNGDLEHAKDGIITNRVFTVPMQADYTIDYSIEIPRFTKASKPGLCFDCVYDIEINLIDQCGEQLLDGNTLLSGMQPYRRTLGKLSTNYNKNDFDTICEETEIIYSFTNDDSLSNDKITINLPIGSYTLIKRLTINYEALEYYENKFLNNNDSIRTEQSFIDQFEANIDYSNCGITCDNCLEKLGTRNDHIHKQVLKLIDMSITPTDEDTTVFNNQYDDLEAYCSKLCNESSFVCENMLEIMKQDVMPGGQYALYNGDEYEYKGLLNLDGEPGLTFNYKYYWSSSNDPMNPDGRIQYKDKDGNAFNVLIDGEYKAPNELNAPQFIANFNPQWANALVKFHPEYCKYQACLNDEASNTYDNNMLRVTNWNTAVDSGFLNPLKDAGISFTQTRIDPFFAASGRGYTEKTDFKNLLDNYQNLNPGDGCPDMSLWETVYTAYKCNINSTASCGEINSCLGAINWSQCTPYQDKMWEMFRTLYLAEKQKIKDALNAENGCNGAPEGEGYTFVTRFPTIADATANLSSDNSSKETISTEIKQKMFVQCDSNCSSQANAWMQQLSGCAMSSSAKDTLKARLIRVCRNACDFEHPFGASNVPNGRAITVGPSLRSFKAVFDDMVNNSLITKVPGICDMNKLTVNDYNHEETNHDANPADTNRCDSSWVNAPNCIKNEKNHGRKLAMAATSPIHQASTCEKCIDCEQFKLAVDYLFEEYNQNFWDTTYTMRQVATNVINKYLQFNLTWPDYEVFARKCLDMDDSIPDSTILRSFKSGFVSLASLEADFSIPSPALFKLNQPYCKKSYFLTESPLIFDDRFTTASVDGIDAIHTAPDNKFLSPCMCGKMAQQWNTAPNETAFNNFFNTGCDLPQPFNFYAVYQKCLQAWGADADVTTPLSGPTQPWSDNQKEALQNIGLEEELEVPYCNFDCSDTKDPSEKAAWYGPPGEHFDYETGEYEGGGNNDPETPKYKIPCDSFMMFLQQLKTLPPYFIDLESIFHQYMYRGELLSGDTTQMNTAMNLFYGVGSIPPGFQTYPHAYRETRFSGFEKFRAFIYLYAHCLGMDGNSGPCCYRKTKYAYLLEKMLNAFAQPKGSLGNYFAYNGWRLTVNNQPRYYNTDLYKNTVKSCSTSLKYRNRVYAMPRIQFTLRDSCNDSSRVYLFFNEYMGRKVNFSKITRFYNLQPVSDYTCDTTHYFDIGAEITTKDGEILHTTLNGYVTRYKMQDTCRASDTMRLCDRPFIQTIPYVNNCEEKLKIMADFHAKKAYTEYIDSLRHDFRERYLAKCMTGFENETFEMGYPHLQYHYTLYYYDQAGNLIQTVPPAGVDVNTGSTFLSNVKTARNNNTSGYFPSHTYVTRYKFNTLDQLVWQTTPDGGASKFWYDKVGRLVISQNAKQAVVVSSKKRYSYTNFDALGRIREVGELAKTTDMTVAIAFDPEDLADFINDEAKTEVTRTYYDVSIGSFPNNTLFVQDNLRSRVSSIQYFPTLVSGFEAAGTYSQGVHYTYDIHGNVNTLLREIPALESIGQSYKSTMYNYDLVSGNVNHVIYQYGQADMWAHRYTYDGDNRITGAYTSHNLVHWDKDAGYKYYLHGPMARTELGQLKVQGIDYAYTLHGWIKGVNSTTLQPDRDIGHDGDAGSANQYVARDVFGYSLGYYEGEHDAIGKHRVSSPLAVEDYFTLKTTGSTLNTASPDLWNGNIRHMVTAIQPFMSGGGLPQARAYNYDQLNRLTAAYTYNQGSLVDNEWSTSAGAAYEYEEHFSYDANGNILTLSRKGAGSPIDMDDFTYHYASGTNQLTYVDDAVTAGNYSDDIDDQSSGNYTYDAIGNMISDAAEEIDEIEWTVYGKIKKITRGTGSSKADLEYEYSPDGHRVSKKVVVPGGNTTFTYYIRDAQGNTMSTYTYSLDTFRWTEAYMYGSSRLGVYYADRVLMVDTNEIDDSLAANEYTNIRGKRHYELSNHLGNVLAVISDRRTGICTGEDLTAYTAEVMDATDYYSFGSPMPLRQGVLRCRPDTVVNIDSVAAYIVNETFGGFGATGMFNANTASTTLTNSTGTEMHVESVWPDNAAAYVSTNLVYGRTYTLTFDINSIYYLAGNDSVECRILIPGSPIIYDFTTTGSQSITFSSNYSGTVDIEFAYITNQNSTYTGLKPYFDIDNVLLGEFSYYNTYDINTHCDLDKNGYRYGFNGKENSNEISSGCYTFEARIFDSRIVKFFSTDPKEAEYAWQSPYAYCRNSPISVIDFNGLGSEEEEEEDDIPVITAAPENPEYKNSNSAPEGEPTTRWWFYKEVHKESDKPVQNYTYITPNNYPANTNTTIRLRVKKAATISFIPFAVPDKMIVYRKYLFFIRKKIYETQWTITNHNLGVKRGRYTIKVLDLNDPRSNAPSTLLLTFTGATTIGNGAVGITVPGAPQIRTSSYTLNIDARYTKHTDKIIHRWMGLIRIPTGKATPRRKDKVISYLPGSKKSKNINKQKKHFLKRTH